MADALRMHRTQRNAGWLARLASALGNRRMEAALLLASLGWSLMWAEALSLVSIVPTWWFAGCFLAGLGLIPFCTGRTRRTPFT